MQSSISFSALIASLASGASAQGKKEVVALLSSRNMLIAVGLIILGLAVFMWMNGCCGGACAANKSGMKKKRQAAASGAAARSASSDSKRNSSTSSLRKSPRKSKQPSAK